MNHFRGPMNLFPKLGSLRRYSTILPRGRVLLHDDMSSTHGQRLEATLSSHLPKVEPSLSPNSDAPCGSHLIYFNHSTPESLLNEDGYDSLQAPQGEVSFLRRWVSGSVTFNLSSPLKLGQPAFCEESIKGAEDLSKSKKTEKISVEIEREIRQAPATNWCIKELRTLLYITNSDRVRSSMQKKPGALPSVTRPAEDPLAKHTLQITSPLLFRYSALTFNAHKIHYDPAYSQQTEGLDRPIAQGPLLLTLALRWLEMSLLPPGFGIYQIAYKVLESVPVDESICLEVFPTPNAPTNFRVLISTPQCVAFEAQVELSRKPANVGSL